jgi:hypothetical protein
LRLINSIIKIRGGNMISEHINKTLCHKIIGDADVNNQIFEIQNQKAGTSGGWCPTAPNC